MRDRYSLQGIGWRTALAAEDVSGRHVVIAEQGRLLLVDTQTGGVYRDGTLRGPAVGGAVSLDGSKYQANASKHKAMSYGRIQEEEPKLIAEIFSNDAS